MESRPTESSLKETTEKESDSWDVHLDETRHVVLLPNNVLRLVLPWIRDNTWTCYDFTGHVWLPWLLARQPRLPLEGKRARWRAIFDIQSDSAAI